MSSRNKRTRRCESEIRTMSRLEPTSTAFIFIFFCVGFRCFADAWNYEKFMARFFCSANRALSQWFSCNVEFEILTVVCVCVWAFATSKAKCQFGKNLTKAATTTKMIEKPTFKWKENGRKRERQENIVMFKGLFDVCWCAFQSIASTKSHESHSIGKRIETFISAGKWKVASFNAISIAGERRLCSSLEFLENMKRKSATISYRRLGL